MVHVQYPISSFLWKSAHCDFGSSRKALESRIKCPPYVHHLKPNKRSSPGESSQVCHDIPSGHLDVQTFTVRESKTPGNLTPDCTWFLVCAAAFPTSFGQHHPKSKSPAPPKQPILPSIALYVARCQVLRWQVRTIQTNMVPCWHPKGKSPPTKPVAVVECPHIHPWQNGAMENNRAPGIWGSWLSGWSGIALQL